MLCDNQLDLTKKMLLSGLKQEVHTVFSHRCSEFLTINNQLH